MPLARSLAPLACLAFAAPAGATTLQALDVPGLTRLSDVVLRGTVRQVKPRLTSDGARVMTDATIEVRELWRGEAPAQVVVMQPGGEVGEVGQRVEGVARFVPGEDVVVFLERRGERFLVTGMVQGKFTLQRTPDGKTELALQPAEAEAVLLDASTGKPRAYAGLRYTVDELRRLVRTSPAAAPAPGPTAPAMGPPGPTSPLLQGPEPVRAGSGR